MKLSVNEEGDAIVVTEVYQGFLMRTREGNEIAICMRDDTFEINIMSQGKHSRNWWRVDMQEGGVFRMSREGIDSDEDGTTYCGDGG